MEYGGLTVFQDITDGEVEAMIRCFRMRRVRFEAGGTICAYSGSGTEVGVVLRGAAELVRFDYEGIRTILERMEPGGGFGEMFTFTDSAGDALEVVSAGNSEVLFMEYDRLMGRCENACAHHSTLVRNMFHLVTEQTRRLSRRVEVLSRRSIRDKLMCWFPVLPAGCGRGYVYAALYAERFGGLYQHGPVGHDAGAEKIEE